MNKRIWMCYLLMSLVATGNLWAQAGYSSGSVSLNRERIRRGQQPSTYQPTTVHTHPRQVIGTQYPNRVLVPESALLDPNEIIVEEFMNYHLHEIRLPEEGEGVALEVRANAIERLSTGTRYAVQVGIATDPAHRSYQRPPVKVAIVIDGSGSMQGDQKMDKVKRALRTFLGELQGGDQVSLIRFSNNATILHAMQPVDHGHPAQQSLDQLYPGGGTNLFAGISLGLQTLVQSRDVEEEGETISKLIVLTDGIANQGITEAHAILAQLQSYIQTGLQISTIGVGEDVNSELLRQLASRSGGQHHFIGSSQEDIDKVFRQEAQSLLAPVAHDPTLSIDLPAGVQVEKVFGYAPYFAGRTIRQSLPDLNRGLTQVFIFTCLVPFEQEAAQIGVRLEATLNADYESVVWRDQLRLNEHRIGWKDSELKKNYHIALMAQTMKDVALACQQQNCYLATQQMSATESSLAFAYPSLHDPDLLRVWNMMNGHVRDWRYFSCRE